MLSSDLRVGHRSVGAARTRDATYVRTAALRVAFLNHVGDEFGGAERTLEATLRHLPPEIEPLVVLFEDGKFARHLRELGVAVEIVPAAPAVMRASRERVALRTALHVPGLVLRIARLLRERRIGLLYTNSMKAHVLGSFAGRLAGVPCVMHFHDHIDGFGLGLLRFVARFGSGRRIACSDEVRRHIGLGRTTVVHSPVELDTFADLPSRASAREELGLDPGVPVVAIVGRINRWKGHDRFVRIAAAVAAIRPVQFLIVGAPIFRDEDFVPELHAMVRELGLTNVVKFVPWVDDVRTVFAATDVLANTSTREPLGRTPAEAAAAGVPSVVFDDSGAAEWLLESGEGRVVPAGDERAFASAVLDLLEPDGASQMRAPLIRAVAARFDPVRTGARLAGLMQAAADP